MNLSRRGILGGGALAALAAPFAAMREVAARRGVGLGLNDVKMPLGVPYDPSSIGKAARALLVNLQGEQNKVLYGTPQIPHVVYGIGVDADLAVLPAASPGWLLARQRERNKRRNSLAEQLQRRIDAIFENPFNVVGS